MALPLGIRTAMRPRSVRKHSFVQRLQRQDLAERVKADLLRGNSLGVKGTPTVYLNGRELVPGKLVTEEDLRREIEAALAQGK